MQSVRAGAVQTYFFIFTLFLKSRSKQTPFGLHFGDNFRLKCHIWMKKGAAKKGLKKLPRQSQTRPYSHVPGLPGSYPKVKDCLSKKQQSEQDLSKKQLSEQETKTAAHFGSISKLLTSFVRVVLFSTVVLSCSIST